MLSGGDPEGIKRHRGPAADHLLHNETDHRIANGLQFLASMLRHESRQITTAASARDALNKAAARLGAMARLHLELTRSLPNTKIRLADFLEQFCVDIHESTRARVKVKSGNLMVAAHVAGQICLVLNELAMNAVKHGGHDEEAVLLTLNAARRSEGIWL